MSNVGNLLPIVKNWRKKWAKNLENLNIYANFVAEKITPMETIQTPEQVKQRELCEHIKQRVEQLLKERRMNRSDLAQALGKSAPEVSRWLTGRHNLTVATIAKMALVLGDDIITVTTSRRKPARHYEEITPTVTLAAEEDETRSHN